MNLEALCANHLDNHFMYPLRTKKSFGTINLEWNNGIQEEYQVGEGRLSLTPYRDFYLINFWIVSEYEILLPDEQEQLVSGPIVEILAKVEHPGDLVSLELAIPDRDEAGDEWDVIYRTGFYNQIHQDLNDSKLIIKEKRDNFYEIFLHGKPDADGNNYSVASQCSLELSHTLERYW